MRHQQFVLPLRSRHELLRRQARTLTEELLREKAESDPARICQAYRCTQGRLPTGHEVERARVFLTDYATVYRKQTALALSKHSRPASRVKQNGPRLQVFRPEQSTPRDERPVENETRSDDAHTAAWLALVQALYSAGKMRQAK